MPWNQMWRNFCVNDTYEPGSPAKPMTVAAGLEEGVISQNDTFLCDGGQDVGGYRIKCSNIYGHGILTLEQSLMKSCNDAMMQIAAKLGVQRLQNIRNYSAWVRRPESIFRERHMD